MSICFVIMPFGDTNEIHTKEYWEEHFEYFIKPAIESASDGHRLLGFTAKLSDPSGGGIIGDVFRNLQESDVVLADLTDFGPSVMYELGVRHCLRDRTIMIMEEGQPRPFYFQNYKIIYYNKNSVKDFNIFKEAIQRCLLEFKNKDRVPWDNPVSDYFRGIGQKMMLVSMHSPDMTYNYVRESGITTIYVPSSNAERNVRKEDVIFQSNETIELLAITGHSFLAMVGNRFKGAFVNRLKNNQSIKIILLNPWCDSSIFIAFGELIGKNSSLSKTQSLAYNKLKNGELKGFDPISFIEESIYYRYKLKESIDGYLELQDQFSNLIQLKLINHEIAATLLLTEKTGFIEPYLNVNLNERMRNLMLTFEVEFGHSSYLYPTCKTYFNTLWNISMPYENFITAQNEIKSQFKMRYLEKH